MGKRTTESTDKITEKERKREATDGMGLSRGAMYMDEEGDHGRGKRGSRKSKWRKQHRWGGWDRIE